MPSAPDVVAIGGVHCDTIGSTDGPLRHGTSNPGTVVRRTGGVSFTVAAHLAAQGLSVRLIGAIGSDTEGAVIAADLAARGIEDGLLRTPQPTGHYVALEDGAGALLAGVSAMPALDALTAADLEPVLKAALPARWWFADANLSEGLLARISTFPKRPPLAVDAVSVAKAARIAATMAAIDLVFCNRDEAANLDASAAGAIVITDGPRPVTVRKGEDRIALPVPTLQAHTATGAGDALIAGTLAALINGQSLANAVAAGIDRAAHVVSAAPS